MSREAEVATVLLADATLMAILLGGVYQSGLLGLEGITRETTAAAFGADGYLKPCALVKDRALLPFGGLADQVDKVVSASQVVEVYLYQDRNFDAIYLAKERIFSLLFGYQFTRAYPATWVLEVGPLPDVGPLKGNTTLRQDWQIVSIRRGS